MLVGIINVGIYYIMSTAAAPQTLGGIPQFQTTGQSGNPRMAALEAMNSNAAKQAALNNAAQGGSRRRIRGGQTVTLPNAPTPIYNDANSNTPFGANNQIKGAMVTTLNQNAQAQYDGKVQLAQPQTRGGKGRKSLKTKGKKRRGGFVWPCLSGGKKSKKRLARKERKSRKNRK
jgi:hypothetical protein